MVAPEDIFAKVEELERTVAKLVRLIEGDGSYSAGLLSVIEANTAYINRRRASDENRRASKTIAIFVFALSCILAVFRNSILISDIRHQIGLQPWDAVAISSVLQIIVILGFVYSGSIFWRD